MKVITINKKAWHNYSIIDTYEAGIVLEGSEVKSVRNGSFSLNESFIKFKNNELFLINAYIKPYENSSIFTPDSRKNRKLLLNSAEIDKIRKKIELQGLAIVPLKVYFNDKNLVKLEIAVAKGKKLFDKREDLKEKTIKRKLERQED